MKRGILVILLFLAITHIFGQSRLIEIDKEYANINIDRDNNLNYSFRLKKGNLYVFSVLQQGIDVKLIFTDENNKQILEKDSPNGQNGYEKFEYSPTQTKIYQLKIVRLDEDGNSEKGQVTILVKKLSKSEIELREKIKKELEPENKKTVQTLDIDHFWEAFDNLKHCKTRKDSINSFQTIYLDRGTDGLKDFIEAREFTAEKFVNQVSNFPKFYNSIRKNTIEAKNSVAIIEDVVNKFREIYPNFKPKKICFAIGLINTGGTVSENFLLIGTEVTTSTKDVDLSEFNNNAYSKVLSSGTDIGQNIKNMVSHEYVHTQQKYSLNKDAINCPLLYAILHEGICDFIGELISGSQINKVAHTYGDKHEKQLWTELKNELCNESIANWLYNHKSVKEKPADLGYYMGYKIAEEYYKNARDKRQAIIDIIEMEDPIKFLQISKYDQKKK
ncbi:DUF2268 domain-containing putative Zn-dependent protease [Riemerella anatipestifer]|nr:DUF2268 domain-containing putative Zn-dependent protease [Riemerella anatipestifer]MDY3326138.1 DUF2268 domain-containing putative Zn-dependent protease [Riemerella anatipestifer]MDY3354488.1 DUF2268 domain-containing putative Zn-dependent protease [Riemerella anatipestifer]